MTLGRIQPPGDAVNAFAIGAAGSTKKNGEGHPIAPLDLGVARVTLSLMSWLLEVLMRNLFQYLVL